ncbi:MAG: spore coat protein CotJB [Clostridiales bacterium]|nr:spore coat protein CotJB [Clostridiales bacterium]
MDRMTEQCLRRKIQEARFACIDLQLYLDTHPDDMAAMIDYNCYSEALNRLICKFDQEFSPLLGFGQSLMETGSWVFDRWPWEV